MTTNSSINTPIFTLTSHGIMVAQGTAATNAIVLSAGQVLIGTTSGDPSGATLTAGTGVSINSVSGSITISSNGGRVWVDQTSGSVTMAVNTGYVVDNGASLVTLTLPSTAAIGDTVYIVGKSAGGWSVAQATGQQIHFGNATTTSGASGSLSSSNQYDCVTLTCVTANNIFVAYGVQGNLTVV